MRGAGDWSGELFVASEMDGTGRILHQRGRARRLPRTDEKPDGLFGRRSGRGVDAPRGVDWSDSLLRGTPQGTAVYLVHSYFVIPDDPRHSLAHCIYGGHRIAAAIRRGRVVGCQFHPEKSGEAGLAMLAQFLHP